MEVDRGQRAGLGLGPGVPPELGPIGLKGGEGVVGDLRRHARPLVALVHADVEPQIVQPGIAFDGHGRRLVVILEFDGPMGVRVRRVEDVVGDVNVADAARFHRPGEDQTIVPFDVVAVDIHVVGGGIDEERRAAGFAGNEIRLSDDDVVAQFDAVAVADDDAAGRAGTDDVVVQDDVPDVYRGVVQLDAVARERASDDVVLNDGRGGVGGVHAGAEINAMDPVLRL